MIKVVSGFIEIKTKDPYMRSFLIPGINENRRVNVWHNDKNSFLTMSVDVHQAYRSKKQCYKKRCLTKEQVFGFLTEPETFFSPKYRTTSERKVR